MLYNDGLASIIAFGGVYASATFDWNTTTLGVFGIILTVFAIPGAFLGGKLDDYFGSKRTVQIAIAGVIIATLGIVSVTADRVLFVIPADPIGPTRAMFGSAQEKAFMAFALLLGFCMGPMQAASRTLIGRLAPVGMTGEFYGLFALSGRATAWMAPLAIGIITRPRNRHGSAWPACCSSWCWASCCCGGARGAGAGPRLSTARARSPQLGHATRAGFSRRAPRLHREAMMRSCANACR